MKFPIDCHGKLFKGTIIILVGYKHTWKQEEAYSVRIIHIAYVRMTFAIFFLLSVCLF